MRDAPAVVVVPLSVVDLALELGDGADAVSADGLECGVDLVEALLVCWCGGEVAQVRGDERGGTVRGWRCGGEGGWCRVGRGWIEVVRVLADLHGGAERASEGQERERRTRWGDGNELALASAGRWIAGCSCLMTLLYSLPVTRPPLAGEGTAPPRSTLVVSLSPGLLTRSHSNRRSSSTDACRRCRGTSLSTWLPNTEPR